MKFLKESFLKFNTYTQIQIGVIGVAFCIFFISVCLLSIISLILINTVYTEIQAILELKENDQINAISVYIDTQLNMGMEISKIFEYNARAFMDNNIRNPDFISNFNSNQNSIIKYTTTDLNINYPLKIYERCFSHATYSNAEYIKLKKILAAYIPVLHYTSTFKFYKNEDTTMYKLISLYSNQFKCLLYYPYKDIKPKYTENNFIIFISAMLSSINRDLDKYINNYNLKNYKSFLAQNLNRNPLSTGYYAIEEKGLTEFYQTNNSSLHSGQMNLITLSAKFKDSIPTGVKFDTLTSNFTLSDIDDFLVFEFSDEMVDKILVDNFYIFRGFKTIIFNEKLLGKTSCGIMQNIYYIYNNLSQIQKFNLNNVTDCFLLKEKPEDTTTLFQNYFDDKIFQQSSSSVNNINQELKDNFRRFVKLPIAYDIRYPNNTEKAINYKILKFRAADITTRILINSFFTVWLRPTIYILKNYSTISNYFKVIYTRFLSTMLKIICANIGISFVTGILVVILAITVSKSIGEPINKLINVVKNINTKKLEKKKENSTINNSNNLNNSNSAILTNTREKEKNLDLIKFEDDETINKFFEICKKLIKGGLANENLKASHLYKYDDAYNNISYMKSNNLIVQEDQIEKETESRVDKIFNHDSILEKIKTSEKFYLNPKEDSYNNHKKINVIYSNHIRETKGTNISHNNQNSSLEDKNNENIFTYNNLSGQLTKNTNVINNSDEIKEIKIEKRTQVNQNNTTQNGVSVFKTVNFQSPNPINFKSRGSFASDSSKNPNFGSNSENNNFNKYKYESIDIFPFYQERKSELEVYFQNTKSNTINLKYDFINLLMNSNFDSRKFDINEKNENKDEIFYDKILMKHFTKEQIDKIFDFFQTFCNNKC